MTDTKKTPEKAVSKASAPNTPASFKEETINHVLEKINELRGNKQIVLPPNYEPSNALQAAWFKLIEVPKGKDKALVDSCTKASIANSLFKMVADGLNPGKNQCYFIPYGNVLQCQRSYQGTIALAKRFGGLKSISANVIYDGDKFSFEIDIQTGNKIVKEHASSIDNFGKEIKGAYAVITLDDGTVFAEIMSMVMIKKAWAQGATKGESPAHRNFDDQMAIKTVINRACKTLINSSDDAVLHTDTDDDTQNDRVAEAVKEEIKINANKEIINIDEHQVGDEHPINIDEAEASEEVAEANGQDDSDGPGF